jgi:hypothetical protein
MKQTLLVSLWSKLMEEGLMEKVGFFPFNQLNCTKDFLSF